MGDFPKDIKKNKQKWLEEWDSVCTIYKPHMPDMMQLLKLTLSSDLRDKIIDVCEIPTNPTEFAKITPEDAQTFYNIISLAVEKEVNQQVDFTAFTKVKQNKEESPRELYERMMTMAKENCGLTKNQIDTLPPGYIQNLFVNSLQPKIKTKVQLTVGWTGKAMCELVEIAQHHWDNTEQKEYRMHEMLMSAQVSHYTGGANRGGHIGRGHSKRRVQNGGQRGHGQYRQVHTAGRNYTNCNYCGEPNHWVRNCPHKPHHTNPSLPTAPPFEEDRQPP